MVNVSKQRKDNNRKLAEKNKKAKQQIFVYFPNCIGTFPDDNCKNATLEKPLLDCFKCPYFKKKY